jgi:hypothetical protein
MLPHCPLIFPLKPPGDAMCDDTVSQLSALHTPAARLRAPPGRFAVVKTPGELDRREAWRMRHCPLREFSIVLKANLLTMNTD